MDDAAPDVMDALAGLAPGSPLAALRRERPEVVRTMQASDRAIFSPEDDGGLSRAERAAAALRIAILLRDAVLDRHYRARLATLDPTGDLASRVKSDAAAGADRRWDALMAHVDRVTDDPDSATRGDLGALASVGLSPHAVVSLSQVIAYVNFQSRVLAGLRMLGEA